jgi:hypothetical protein
LGTPRIPDKAVEFISSVLISVSGATENKKAVRQLGRPFLSRENSSNGGSKKPSELSGKNLKRGPNLVSRNISRINAFVFNYLTYSTTFFVKLPKFTIETIGN